jgi:NAD-reducing hydrogenase small subunit
MAVDATLVEGAVANEDHLAILRKVRARSRVLVALGDCAVAGNVTALRNPLGSADTVLNQVYGTGVGARIPGGPDAGRGGEADVVPRLLDRVIPLHQAVPVDLFLPGCPPSADLIHHVLCELVAGRMPDVTGRLRFG